MPQLLPRKIPVLCLREKLNTRTGICAGSSIPVIASAAKQSSAVLVRNCALDCFAALAMTGNRPRTIFDEKFAG
jgi:hypothetical protein